MLVILSGSSGVGKNTLIDIIMDRNDNVKLMPTLTTRSKRPGEKQGKPFYFLSKEEFENKIRNKELFEHENIHGNLYGSSRKIYKELSSKDNILIKDIGVLGAKNLSETIGQYDKVLKIFLYTFTRYTLRRRLLKRGETEIDKRLKRYTYEQSKKRGFNYLIFNNNKEKAVALIEKLIKYELLSNHDSSNIVYAKKIIDIKDVKRQARKLAKKKKTPIIKVGIIDNKMYLLSNINKYIALLKTKDTIPKKIKLIKKGKKSSWEKIDPSLVGPILSN